MKIKVGIGQDSHRFEEKRDHKPLILGGVKIQSELALTGNSDADVILHALCHAISGISGKIIIGTYSDKLCKEQGIIDSVEYVREALKTLKSFQITHVSVTIECYIPRIDPYIEKMRSKISEILSIGIEDVMITATSGEGLTPFGQGKGVQAFVVVTAMRD